MVKTKPSSKVERKYKPKNVHLKKHHQKAYRKRHVALLVSSIIGLVIILSILIWYRDSIITGFASSREFVSGLFKKDAAESQLGVIQSTHNIGLSYDQRSFYASAVDANTGTLYVGNELTSAAAFTSIRLSIIPGSDTQDSLAQPSFTLTVHPSYSGNADLTTIALADAGISPDSLVQFTPTSVQYGDATFSRTVLQSQGSDSLVASLNSQYSVYTTIKNGSLVTIVIAHGPTAADQDNSFEQVLKSLTFSAPVSSAAPTTLEAGRVAMGASPVSQPAVIDLLDLATNTQGVAAATKLASVDASEKIGALYSPAVPKIYNAYCMDIQVQGTVLFKEACSASMGTGFILTGDGYVGTNGHVATADPRDLAIYNALSYAAYKNDTRYLEFLVKAANITNGDVAGKTGKVLWSYVVNQLYELDASQFTAVNSIQNLLVGVAGDTPNVTTLVANTKARREYAGTDTIVRAELLASDYRQAELFTGTLSASDVALLKLEEGDSYPTVKLGEITDITQGANLSIIGFPGNANTNGIVSTENATPTLTSGKVSSVKDASGSTKKLIETDTTIGHGNSGGPAMNDSGMVVGVATYTADGGGEGDGTYNYIRDIADLKTLMDNEGVIAEPSLTQIAWETGMDKYYNSHYSSALKYFDEVKTLYPNHTKVDEFIASAEKHIANGDDISEFPLWIVWVGLGTVLLGAGLGTFFIIHHAKRHKVYKAGVAQGAVQPDDISKGVKHPVVVTASAPTVVSATPVMPVASPTPAAAPVEPTAPQSPPAPDQNNQPQA